MAKVHGRNAYLTIDGKLVSADGNSITLDITGDAAEWICFGSWWKSNDPGPIGAVLSGEFYWDIETNHADHEIWNQWEASKVTFSFRPGGSAVNNYEYSGYVISGKYTISAPIGGMVTGSFSQPITGQVLRTILT